MRETVKAALWAILGFTIGFITAGLTNPANAEENFSLWENYGYKNGTITQSGNGYKINTWDSNTKSYKSTTIKPTGNGTYNFNTFDHKTSKQTWGTIKTDKPIMGIFKE